MKKTSIALIGSLLLIFLATEIHAATTWNVSLWGKRRAFTENVEKLAELGISDPQCAAQPAA